MIKNPRISVIIPCFNQGIYVDDAIESVLNQSYTDLEVIIINDGSYDEFTINKLNNYSKPNARIINTSNKGLSAARNLGVKESNGKFIQFLDADDCIHPMKFEKQIGIFNEHPEIEICYSNYKVLDLQSNKYLLEGSPNLNFNISLEKFLFDWEKVFSIPIHCGLFKKSIWRENPPFDERLKAKEDWVMWCTLAANGRKFYFLDENYAIYRMHTQNMTRKSSEMSYYHCLALFCILEFIPNNLKMPFLQHAITYNQNLFEEKRFPELLDKINDLKYRLNTIEKTIDFRIGNLLLKPYRFIKSKLF